MEFVEHRLENGLELIAECHDRAHSAALGFFVRTGSRDETDAEWGVSHFLEHMVFKGTPTRTADDVNREFDEIGAHYNAFTSEENTVYYAAVLPEFQVRAFELWADILRPSLRPDDFETEKQVILEEIQMYEDQPPFGADDKCKALHFGPHPLGRSVLGTIESITRLPVETMQEYFRCRYSPGNVTVAATGRIDFDALVASAQRWCGHWEPASAERRTPKAEPADGFRVLHKPSATQQYVVQLADGPAADEHDRHAARLLATVLGDETGSRLYWELVDPGRAESASLHHYEYEGVGLMMTYLSCEPERTGENLQIAHDVYGRTQSRAPITADELAQAKSKTKSRIVLSSERPRGRLFAVGGEWIHRRRYLSVRDDLEAIAAVSLDEVAAVLARYPLTRNTTVTIGPLAEVRRPR